MWLVSLEIWMTSCFGGGGASSANRGDAGCSKPSPPGPLAAGMAESALGSAGWSAPCRPANECGFANAAASAAGRAAATGSAAAAWP